MKILLINVSLRPNSPVKIFPVGLSYIATALKNSGHDFDLIDIDGHRYTDEDVNKMIAAKNYDIVCFGCIVTGYKIAKNLARRIRNLQPQAKIILGNTVGTSIPQIVLEKTAVDFVVMGEGDRTIVELVECIAKGQCPSAVDGIAFVRDGKFILTKSRDKIKNLDEIDWIDFSLFDTEIYIENMKVQLPDTFPIPREGVRGLPINSARGCIAGCTFCYHAFQGVPYRKRSTDSVLREAQDLIEKYDVNMIALADELTFYKKNQVRDFAQEILRRGLKFFWACQCRAELFDSEDDLETIALMKEAGCYAATFSLESADPAILKAMNKSISVEQFIRQSHLFQQGRIPVHTSLVFGYPQETPESIDRTFDICIEAGIYPSSGFLLPQPGSGMYDYAMQNGFIPDEEAYLLSLGDRQDLRLNLTDMPDEEFIERVMQGAQRCSDALQIGLSKESLIKTGVYRGAKQERKSA